LHGDKDAFLDMETHGRQVYNNYKGIYAEAHIVAGAEHSTVPQTIGLAAYNEALFNFILR
jgi:hypothetical protein